MITPMRLSVTPSRTMSMQNEDRLGSFLPFLVGGEKPNCPNSHIFSIWGTISGISAVIDVIVICIAIGNFGDNADPFLLVAFFFL